MQEIIEILVSIKEQFGAWQLKYKISNNGQLGCRMVHTRRQWSQPLDRAVHTTKGVQWSCQIIAHYSKYCDEDLFQIGLCKLSAYDEMGFLPRGH
jgi:hypothetical protein